MKYIQKRNKFSELSKINEILDSDNLDVDFSDTLIGGTLNRLFGFIRSNLSDANMKKYSKALDRLLASMVIQPSLDELNNGKSEEEQVSLDELTEEGQKMQSAILYLTGVKQASEGKMEEAQKTLEQIPQEVLKGLPEGEKVSSLILYKEEETEETSEFKDGDMAIYNNTQVQVVSVGDDLAKVKNEEGEETEVNLNELQLSEEGNGDGVKDVDISKESSMLDKYEKEIIEMVESCVKCIKDDILLKKFNTVAKSAKSMIEALKIALNRTNKVDDANLNTFKVARGRLIEFCEACKESDVTENKVNEKLIMILEKAEAEAVDVLTNKDFDRIKKDLDKQSKEWKISEEDLRNLNKELAETKGIGEISGDNAKKLMEILTKAKNSLLFTKPYEEIGKKQKRYYDKLDSGRAVNRKAYQKWTKNVMELVNYYKDKLPKKVITVISDSVDKDAISNDYVKINKEFLGVDRRENKGDLFNDKDSAKTDTPTSEIKVGTNDNKLRFVGVNSLVMSSKICFVMDVTSTSGKSGFYTGVIFRNGKNSFEFKYIRGINIKWLEGYYGDKTIDVKTDKPDTKIKTVNDDLNGVNIEKTNKYGPVVYAEGTVKSIELNKGDKISIKALNFSELISGDLTEVDGVKILDEETMNTINYETTKWEVNKLGVLVGSNDMKASTYKINSSNLNPDMDGFFDQKLYNQLSEIFSDSVEKAEIDIDNLEEGDKIKYTMSNGKSNNGVVGAREDLKKDTLRVTTDNKPEGFIINKNQIIK